MLDSLCSSIVKTRRGLLAFIWSLVTLAALFSFVAALLFAANNVSDSSDDAAYEQQEEPQVAVTSRAMVFAALWTAVLASLMGMFGTVILGFQSPTGVYYTCCSGNVHRTTPLGLGAFIGALLMFGNMTLVCSVLFGEFEVRLFLSTSTCDYWCCCSLSHFPTNMRDPCHCYLHLPTTIDLYAYACMHCHNVQILDYKSSGKNGQDGANSSTTTAIQQSSQAFSIMCMFLTFLYIGFSALTFAYSDAICKENEMDIRDEQFYPQHNHHHQQQQHHHLHHQISSGYIDNRFDVRSHKQQTGYVVPQTGGSGSLI
jgi:hypothetical protein